ncbi:MAG: hypothetical protein A2V57_01170 [Candidatus Aminicenantes bacterium RBG_19FT_COMBO_65_30]|nr:MAG: hypothetical protein A2V57_01170 [Candidatus Aminicenantes bacterium RBG_19FT_COMBO_65_30]
MLRVLDPTLDEWGPLALGSSAHWFAEVVRELAVAETYLGVQQLADRRDAGVDLVRRRPRSPNELRHHHRQRLG